MRQKLVLALVLLFAASAFAVAPVNGKLAVKGYDVVAYFDDGKPVEGSASHEVQWNGATWRFASAATKAKFLAAPEQYAPAVRRVLRVGGQPQLHGRRGSAGVEDRRREAVPQLQRQGAVGVERGRAGEHRESGRELAKAVRKER
jgi:YHS domain-containing protein